MSAQIPAGDLPGLVTTRPERTSAGRVLAVAAVGVGLAALAAGTFVLSYSGIHVLVLQAGLDRKLARGYPALVDAMLVVVLAAMLALRGAGLPSRLLAWVTLLALLAAAAGADALHAAGRRLPEHVAAITVAVVPWAMLFLAFALLLAMLRHARLRRLAAGSRGRGVPSAPPQPAPLTLFARQAMPEQDAPLADPLAWADTTDADPLAWADTTDADTAWPGTTEADSAWPDAAGSNTAEPVAVDGDVASADARPDAAEAGPEPGEPGSDEALEPAADPAMPVFHRMWSSPTPPAGE